MQKTIIAGIFVVLMLVGCGRDNTATPNLPNAPYTPYTPTSFTIYFTTHTAQVQCTTGWHTYSANQFEQYCLDLADHDKMYNCAKDQRENAFAISRCPGEFN